MRPAPLSEVLPQVGLQRHTVEQRIVHTPYVQILDAPVPQMVEQLVDFFKDLDVEVPAQVIEVPKISQDIVPQRSGGPCSAGSGTAGGSADHCILLFASADCGARALTFQFLVVVGGLLVFKVFLPGQSSTTPQKRISERTVDQIVRFPGEGLQDFRPGQSSPASSSFHSPAGSDDDANEPGDGVFHTSPWKKSAECREQVSADLRRHVSSWTPAAYEQSRGFHEQETEKEKKDAEYRRRMFVLNQRVADGLPLGPIEYAAWRRFSGLPPSSSSSSGKRRKRKKRSKRKLSKSSSGVRTRRCVQKVPLSLFFFWCAVFSSVDDRPKMLDIMAGMDQEDTYMLVGFSLWPLVSGSLLFAVLLGSTVDTCYVRLQRLLWEIAENVPFSAQCLVRHSPRR